MLEPFLWMFSIKDFKKHFLYMFFFGLISYIIGYAMIILPPFGGLIIINQVLAFIFLILPTFYTTGYFWNLTEEIINRDWDIILHNIYDGIIKEYYEIALPELNLGKNIWRGIASTVAMILLSLPFIFIIATGTLFNALASLPPVASLVIPIFLTLFIPALLWNYAHRNSVVAVWNIRKAIYLMGNYPLKYILNTIIFVIIYATNGFIDYLAQQFLRTALTNFDPVGLTLSALVIFLMVLKYLYFIYVYAYLLGTIAPTSES